MVSISKTSTIHQKDLKQKKGIDLPLDLPKLLSSNDDWKILHFKGPSLMFEWLDSNKKINHIGYSSFLLKLFVDYHKLKPVLEKILANQDLTPEDILTIHQSLQMEKVL